MDMPTTYSQRVAERVSLAIRSSGRTVASVATDSGIARVTLIRRLAGRSPFTVDELVAIATVLSVDTAALMTDPVAA